VSAPIGKDPRLVFALGGKDQLSIPGAGPDGGVLVLSGRGVAVPHQHRRISDLRWIDGWSIVVHSPDNATEFKTLLQAHRTCQTWLYGPEHLPATPEGIRDLDGRILRINGGLLLRDGSRATPSAALGVFSRALETLLRHGCNPDFHDDSACWAPGPSGIVGPIELLAMKAKTMMDRMAVHHAAIRQHLDEHSDEILQAYLCRL
jgi:hypothetical protein